MPLTLAFAMIVSANVLNLLLKIYGVLILSVMNHVKAFSRQNLLIQYLYRRWIANLIGRCSDTDELILPSLHIRTSIDVGANAGDYARYLSRTSRKLVCFEPVPFMIRLLKMLFNGQSHVSIQQAALSDATGTATLSIPLRTHEAVPALASLKQTFPEAQKIQVETYRFDDFRAANSWLDATSIDFIKIDVEGFELQVLNGMPGTIAMAHPVFLIEIEMRHNSDSLQVFETLAENGYSPYVSRIGGSLEPITISSTQDLLNIQREEDLKRESFNYRVGSERRYLNNFWFIHPQSHLAKQLRPFIKSA